MPDATPSILSPVRKGVVSKRASGVKPVPDLEDKNYEILNGLKINGRIMKKPQTVFKDRACVGERPCLLLFLLSQDCQLGQIPLAELINPKHVS